MRIHLSRLTGPLALAAACAPAPADDLRDALPRVDDLALAVPGGGAEKAAVGEPSSLRVVARRTSEQLNGLIAGAVGTIGAIAAHEPTIADEHHAVWGPIVAPLSPAAYRLVAEAGPDGVSYRLDGWPRAGGDPRVVAAGRATRDGRSGALRVELQALRELDPDAPVDGGFLAIAYDGSTLALDHDQAHYRYAGDPGGGARFVFATGEGVVVAGWRGDGAGRAVVDGVLVECWDSGFRRVFLAGPAGSEGDAAACADVPDGP